MAFLSVDLDFFPWAFLQSNHARDYAERTIDPTQTLARLSGTYGFDSVKLPVILLFPGWDASLSQVTPQHCHWFSQKVQEE